MAVRIDRYQGFGFALAAYYDIFFSEEELVDESERESAPRERCRIVKIEEFVNRQSRNVCFQRTTRRKGAQ